MSLSSFNSRTLGRVRRVYLCGELRHYSVSIPAPWEGCDLYPLYSCCLRYRVSIHAPWEGCDLLHLQYRSYGVEVSIHAPWEGCDVVVSCRVCSEIVFQFTHPGKGATREEAYIIDRYLVSIHAPWEGCDSRSVSRSGREGSFNSRTLGRVRPVMFVLLNVSLPCFNSRTLGRVRPRRGRFRAASRSFNSRTLGRVRQRLICCC